MPGAIFVSNASSLLLSPLPPGSASCLQPSPVASDVGVVFRSVLQVSRLAWPSTADLDALGPFPSPFPELIGTSADSLLAAFSIASVDTARESLVSLARAERADRLSVGRFAARGYKSGSVTCLSSPLPGPSDPGNPLMIRLWGPWSMLSSLLSSPVCGRLYPLAGRLGSIRFVFD